MEFEKPETTYTSFQPGVNQFTFSQPHQIRPQLSTDHEMIIDEQSQLQPYSEETQENPHGFFADSKSAACSVRVALRVRPLLGRELYESPQICVACHPENNQITIGKDRAFTFDKIFDIATKQEDVFEVCVKNLVLGCFQGYNATVLAYGQTGSGKTHTMGSGYTIGLKDEDLGIIPRVIKLIFDEVENRKSKAEFLIKCTFLEIYNEEFHDLLDHQGFSGGISSGQSQPSSAVIDRFIQKKEISIREEKNGNISVYGLREEKVNCYEELAACLDRGSNFRSTASTMMNSCSSRSHAIFTITIEQHIIEDLYKADGGVSQTTNPPAAQANGAMAEEFMVAKFHFVDLAGSERLKRTGASGLVMKQGISINKGLLALGNVISALTEEGKKGHVPYRDSKLTRILQDSLGGNSRTSMIACISPAEINFEETLNSLKYASRARNIKNKPIVNRDPNSAQIAQLRQQVYELSRELAGARKILTSNNIEFEQQVILSNDMLASSDPMIKNQAESSSRQYALGAQELQRLEQEIKSLKIEKSQKDKQLQQTQSQYEATSDQLQSSQLEFFQVQKERDICRFQIEQVTQVLKKRNLFTEVMNEIHGYSNGTKSQDQMEIDSQNPPLTSADSNKEENFDFLFGSSGPCILEEYQVKVEEQKKELADKNSRLKILTKDYEILFEQSNQDMKLLEGKEQEIERLKRSVNKLQKENVQIRTEQRRGSKMPFTNAGGASTVGMNNTQQKGVTDYHPKKKEQSPFGTAQKKKVNQAVVPLQDSSNNQWLSNELDYNIKHFNELFIENLSQSLSTILVAKKAPTATQAKECAGEEDKEQLFNSVVNTTMNGGGDVDMQKQGEESESSDSAGEEEQEENEEEEEQIDEETKRLAQVEAIESNEENKQQDMEMKANLEQHEEQIGFLDGDLKDKENLLDAIKESHKMLQNNLLEAMKNEYHKKIQKLDLDVKLLEKERHEKLNKADSVQQKTKVEEGYKKKMKELEEKLKDLKKKDQDQQAMMKDSSKLKSKIQTLESEIVNVKSQKVGLMKKMKEETENHRKWKNDRGMELIRMKQANQKKDREIQKLKRDNLRQNQLAKRKQDELSALQKKNKTDKEKRIKADNQRQKKKNIDIGQIQGWILTNTDKMLKYKELRNYQQQEQTVSKEVEEQITEEQNQLAILNVRKEKLEYKRSQLELSNGVSGNFEEEIYAITEQIDELELEIKAISENIESLEEKQDFIAQKVSNITTELIGLSPDDVEQLRFDEVQSIEGARACLGAFFGILLDVNVYKKQLENQSIQNEATIDNLKGSVEELSNIQKLNEIQFQKQMEQLNREYREKEELMMRIILENGGIEMEQLLNGESNNAKQTNEIFRQYLKSKENELLMSENGLNGQGQIGTVGLNLKRMNTTSIGGGTQITGGNSSKAADQVKKSKEQQYNQSKMQLSKRVAELERSKRDEEKKFESMRHKFESTNQEKELYKRQVDNFKQKLKIQEIQEIKNSKYAQPSDDQQQQQQQIQQSSNQGVKSPRTHHSQSTHPQNQTTNNTEKQSKLITLHEVRKERKMKKQANHPTTAQSKQNQQQNSGPKVIADEPMEDEDEEGEVESPTTIVAEKLERRNTLMAGGKQLSQLDTLAQKQQSNNVDNSNSDLPANVFSRLSQGGKKMRPIVQNPVVTNNNNCSSLNTSQSVVVQSQNQQQQQDMIFPQGASQQITAGFDDDHKWKCLLSKEAAHSGQICALASVGNQLYSTSNKSLKIWDLDTMTCVSDIQAHSGFIKCMTIWESKNLLLTASEKVIMLWDLISLTNVGILKGHKDEIRAMNVTQDGHILFSGGKGTANGGALLLWDLRKGAMPFDEKEKQQDIFSLSSTKDYLFYGCRNHQVYPMSLKSYEIMHPFDPPHFDVVTSLAMLDNTLVSGSRDKNLRCWDPFSSQLQSSKYSDVMQAHSDWINAMETDYDKKEMYSGGKDGVVKVWRIKKKKLKCMAGLSSNSGSINCLSKIDKGFGKMFAQGSSDKSIRMWKFKDKYLNDQNNQNNDQDDYGNTSSCSPDLGDDLNNDRGGNMEDELEYYSQNANNYNIMAYGIDCNDESSQGEIENQIFAQMDKKEEFKQTQQQQQQQMQGTNGNNEQYKYQPVRQQNNAGQPAMGSSSYSSVTSNNPNQKYQKMRREKRLQDNQKRQQQKENEVGYQQ